LDYITKNVLTNKVNNSDNYSVPRLKISKSSGKDELFPRFPKKLEGKDEDLEPLQGRQKSIEMSKDKGQIRVRLNGQTSMTCPFRATSPMTRTLLDNTWDGNTLAPIVTMH